MFTTTAYSVTEGPNSDMGLWQHKIPVEVLKLGTRQSRSTSGSRPSPVSR